MKKHAMHKVTDYIKKSENNEIFMKDSYYFSYFINKIKWQNCFSLINRKKNKKFGG